MVFPGCQQVTAKMTGPAVHSFQQQAPAPVQAALAGSTEGPVSAALGTKWAHAVNVRLVLERKGDGRVITVGGVSSCCCGKILLRQAFAVASFCCSMPQERVCRVQLLVDCWCPSRHAWQSNLPTSCNNFATNQAKRKHAAYLSGRFACTESVRTCNLGASAWLGCN